MRVYTTVFLLVVLLGFSGVANAVLIDRGTGMIYDTEQGITWLQDVMYSQTSGYDSDGLMNWEDAIAWADQLDYGGYSDWRLPITLNEVTSYGITDGEMGYMFYTILGNEHYTEPGWTEVPNNTVTYSSGYEVTFQNLSRGYHWYGTEASSNPTIAAWAFGFGSGIQDDVHKLNLNKAWAVRDGDYGPSVSTTQTHLTDYLNLGDTFTFDYWWEMGIEPTDFNLDVLFLNEENWETFGWNLNFNGSSSQWETASFWVPEWARGENTRMMFSLLDLGQETNPTVYLRNIGSAAAPVPEPATIILLGTGLLGLVGASRNRFRRQ